MDRTTFWRGFRVVGGKSCERKPTNWAKAFAAYAACDAKAEVDKESFLSAFCFGDEFASHFDRQQSTKGYSGATWCSWLWFDVDRDDIDQAHRDTIQLVTHFIDRWELDREGDELLVFFSGAKGYHVGVPSSLWKPEPSERHHRYCRTFAESLAEQCDVVIDLGVYDAVRLFRAPNSRHSKTGIYKRCVAVDDLFRLRPDQVVELATRPSSFEIPENPSFSDVAATDWQAAIGTTEDTLEAVRQRKADGEPSKLTRATLAFIRDGATNGDRHRLLFSAAANLAEMGCGLELAAALLTEPALDSGLPPSEVRRQIECGINHGRKAFEE